MFILSCPWEYLYLSSSDDEDNDALCKMFADELADLEPGPTLYRPMSNDSYDTCIFAGNFGRARSCCSGVAPVQIGHVLNVTELKQRMCVWLLPKK
jgi:hypothetical protein